MGKDVLVTFVYMVVVFFLAWIWEDNSIVDIAWGGGFIVVALFSLLQGDHVTPRSLLITALVMIWGLRLGWHISRRNRGHGEDFRYRAWESKQRSCSEESTAAPPYSCDSGQPEFRPRPGLDGRSRHRRLDFRFRVRGGRRQAVDAVQAKPGKPREDHDRPVVAVFAASQLFRRGDALVGDVPVRPGGSSRVDRSRRSLGDHPNAPVCFGGSPSGEAIFRKPRFS